MIKGRSVMKGGGGSGVDFLFHSFCTFHHHCSKASFSCHSSSFHYLTQGFILILFHFIIQGHVTLVMFNCLLHK